MGNVAFCGCRQFCKKCLTARTSDRVRPSARPLLWEELALAITARGRKPFMSQEHEARLTDWMATHAAASFLPHSGAWDVEDRLVGSGEPVVPPNLKGASHHFVARLVGTRREVIRQ